MAGVLVIAGYVVVTVASVLALVLCAAVVISELWGDEMPGRREAIDR